MNSKIIKSLIDSDLISRDLSWLKFNYRVLDQVKDPGRNILEKLKFMSIVSSNFDEFFEIRIGSLYNYIDNNKKRIDYSGIRELPFKDLLLSKCKEFYLDQDNYYIDKLLPLLKKKSISICNIDDLDNAGKVKIKRYFKKTLFPMITPMVFDSYHSFPVLMNKVLIFGVITNDRENKHGKKMSFIQIPLNIPRFFEYKSKDSICFVPIEKIIKKHMHKFFRNIEIVSISLFRLIRNGDFTLEESEDIEINFLEELKQKVKDRKFSRVVRLEIEAGFDKWLLDELMKKWKINETNVFEISKNGLIDCSSLLQIINYNEFSDSSPSFPETIMPLPLKQLGQKNIFEILNKNDILLHHPYNSFNPVINLLNESATDPDVLSIKITLYRTAEESRVINALLRAAENGKHVSVLFEVKARFDEENNLINANKLQKAGCYVIYGIGALKIHTKLLLIVKKDKNKVKNYAHLGTGNYNETTSKFYSDISLMTSKKKYTRDALEFFNVITGHSLPDEYENLITAPVRMRKKILELINIEKENSRNGLKSGIVIKINSLQDKRVINALYDASACGVKIKLVVRGICCLRPGRKNLSENISVISIVGDFLEHSRIYYFHNNNDPVLYSGSADIMIRSFDRRIESLFRINDNILKKELISIIYNTLKDNYNSYFLLENGEYEKITPKKKDFNIHKEFFKTKTNNLKGVKLFN